jgi:hypothetical protein
LALSCSPWVILAMWLASRSFSIITRKLSLQPILNIGLFPTHTKLELGVLGVAEKLAKDVVQLWKQNFEKQTNFSFKEF